MNKVLAVLLILIMWACKTEEKKLSAQEIVNLSIQASGGDLYLNSTIAFDFRDRHYISEQKGRQKILKRIIKNDSIHLIDILYTSSFERFRNDSLIALSDSLASRYGNSVNSVHYFSKLPYGLNDQAVHKELLEEAEIKGQSYFKVKVTFNQEGGGDDFDDTYIYFFNQTTYKPDYLAYDFHVNGGGMRFREAYNERYVNGIRFVDYNNMKPVDKGVSVLKIDSLFNTGRLELLSKIELKEITVTQDNYN